MVGLAVPFQLYRMATQNTTNVLIKVYYATRC